MEIQIEKIDNLLKSGINTLTMYRVNFGHRRGYCEIDPFVLYSGLTGALSNATFKGNQEAKRLVKWRDKMIDHLGGQAGQEAYLNSMSDFGTLLHTALLKIKENGKLVWAEERDYANNFFEASAKANGIIPSSQVIQSQTFEYCKSAASLLQFFYDVVIDVYAVEGMARSTDLMIATPIDIVAKIKDKKTEINVCLNLKTSGQFSDHQREQCAVERYLWNQTYDNLQVQKTGLLRAKDWKLNKVPTYELELLDEQTEHEMFSDAFNRLKLCKSNHNSTYLNFPNDILTFGGETLIGGAPKLETQTLEQSVLARI